MKTCIGNLLLRPALIIGLSLVTLPADCLHAAIFNVTTTNISGPGSLLVAIAQANATPGENQIQLSVTDVIRLGLPLPTITNSVTITGIATVPTVISGGGNLPIFAFSAGTTNSLFNLVLANGYTTNNGAAISNSSSLSVSSCVITNHNASTGSTNVFGMNNFGGAVINSGVMAVYSSVISGNRAGEYVPIAGYQSGIGGAIYNSGTLTLNTSRVSDNRAGNGGAVFSVGFLAVNELTMSNNLATSGFGGSVYNIGTLTITSSIFAANGATGASGVPQIDYYQGGGGGGGGFGGALFSSSGTVAITNSTFYLNAAKGGIGGAFSSQAPYYYPSGKGGGGAGGYPGTYGGTGGTGGFGSGGGGGGGSFGGGMGGTGGFGGGGGGGGNYVGHAGVSSFAGGNGAAGTGNSSSGLAGAGGGGAGLGAAVFVQGGNCSLVNCTVANNSSQGGLGGDSYYNNQGSPGQGIAGGIFASGGTVSLLNTIVAGNNAPNGSPDLMGSFVSSGSNLIGNNQGATNLSIFDFQNVAANLGTLQDNGGSTLTCAPLSGSLAIGYGTSTGAPTADQRGVPRPQGGAFDIGAVEVVTGSPIVAGGAMVKSSGFYLNTILDATNRYRIQASTNLTTWIDLSTNGSGGPLHFIDSAATNLNRRFYRTSTP